MNTIKQTKKVNFSFFLVGIGVACILYNFFNWIRSTNQKHDWYCFFVVSFTRAFNSKQGFVYAFIMASTASRKK